ncbi:MAG: T9SS type A sorting domain-containing protein [Melioribacteraceae bacterium]|nr:T9SS type A sorting domain-containing protein [Melioribacteraceae bacterium]
MRKRSIEYCISLLLLISTLTYSQFQLKTSNLPDWSVGYAIDAIDSMTAVVSIGTEDDRPLFITTNGGDSWDTIQVPVDWGVVDVEFTDKDHIWFVYGDGKIYATFNGGIDWILQFNDNNITMFANYIEMFDSQNGVAMCDGNDNVPVFLKTTNGGSDWVSVNNQVIGGWSGDLWRRVDFVNPETGYFYESGIYPAGLYKTINGGANWSKTSCPSIGAQIIKFGDADHGMVYIDKDIFTTSDGGESWSTTSIDLAGWGNDIEYNQNSLSNIWFTQYRSLYQSNDYGKKWNKITGLPDTLQGRDIHITPDNYMWLLCDENIYRVNLNNFSNDGIVTADEINLPEKYNLAQNYPNPFNPATTIEYTIKTVETAQDPSLQLIKLIVYDILGREVATLVNQYQNAGSYKIKFDASDYPSGMYIYTLSAGAFKASRKMLIIK